MENATTPTSPCCQNRTRKRTAEETKALTNRLSRVEGQIRGIRGMLENDAYCPDILTQVAAATAALNGFAKVLLEQHIRTCVMGDLLEGRDDTVEELLDTLGKLMK